MVSRGKLRQCLVHFSSEFLLGCGYFTCKSVPSSLFAPPPHRPGKGRQPEASGASGGNCTTPKAPTIARITKAHGDPRNPKSIINMRSCKSELTNPSQPLHNLYTPRCGDNPWAWAWDFKRSPVWLVFGDGPHKTIQ